MIKKKILFVATKTIFPPVTGDTQIIYNRLLELSKSNEFEISLIVVHRNQKDILGIEEYKKLCNQTWIFKLNFFNNLFVFLKILMGDQRPFQVIYYDNYHIKKKISKIILLKNFNIVNLYLIRSTFFLKNINNKKILVDMIDLMSINFKRRASSSKSLLLRFIYMIEYKRLERYEKFIYENTTKTILVADKESINSTKEISVIPLGIDTELFKPNTNNKNFNIIFTGNMSYEPNIQAITWFIESCFEEILNKYKNSKLIIAGANPSKKIRSYSSTNIVVTGYIKSISEILNSASVAIAPMQSGSGMQFKVLEAMSCGLPVVVTSLGLGSIKAIDKKELIIADNDNTFSQSVINIFDDREKYEQLVIASRKFVLDNHSWIRHVDQVRKIFNSL
tara:strand:+ start:420 stop:1595 length:1176 start_codon:yes stop_codon:yes gene_type:complete